MIAIQLGRLGAKTFCSETYASRIYKLKIYTDNHIDGIVFVKYYIPGTAILYIMYML